MTYNNDCKQQSSHVVLLSPQLFAGLAGGCLMKRSYPDAFRTEL